MPWRFAGGCVVVPGRLRKVRPPPVARGEWRGLGCPFESRAPLASPGALSSGGTGRRAPREVICHPDVHSRLLNLGVGCAPTRRPPVPWGPLRLSPSSAPGFRPPSRVPLSHSLHSSPSPPTPCSPPPGKAWSDPLDSGPRARTPWNPSPILQSLSATLPTHPRATASPRARDLRGFPRV